MPSLADLRALGYELKVAAGSVQTEEDALAAALEHAAPAAVEVDAQQVANGVAAVATARGIQGPQLVELIAKITASAISQLTQARENDVTFHQRAVAIAKTMPTTYVLCGPGVENVYVDFDDATGEPTARSAPMVAALLDPGAHGERLFQHRLRKHPKAEEIFGYVRTLRDKGWTVKAELQEDGTGLQVRITAAGQTETIATTLVQLRSAANDLADLTP